MMDRQTAQSVHDTLLDCSRRIEETVKLVRERCGAEELDAYRKAAAQAMGALLDLREPIYKEHPELEPEDLRNMR